MQSVCNSIPNGLFWFPVPASLDLLVSCIKAKCFEDGRLLLMQPSPTCCEGAKITQTSLCGGCAGGLVVYILAIKPKSITGA